MRGNGKEAIEQIEAGVEDRRISGLVIGHMPPTTMQLSVLRQITEIVGGAGGIVLNRGFSLRGWDMYPEARFLIVSFTEISARTVWIAGEASGKRLPSLHVMDETASVRNALLLNNLGLMPYTYKRLEDLEPEITSLVARARTLTFKPFEIDLDQRRPIKLANLTIFPDIYEATISGENLQLTPTEFRLLAILARHPGRVVPKSVLMDSAWEGVQVDPDEIKTFISHLRKKLPEFKFRAVPGIGYRLIPPERHKDRGEIENGDAQLLAVEGS